MRYETYWLQLAAKHPSECLAAPLDVAWIWHSHLLAPLSHRRDCLSNVGVVVNQS